MTEHDTDIAVIGAGIIGIATAYFLKKADPRLKVTLIDQGQPMAFTSAQSGENYRNWWPHPLIKRFTDHSIDLMEAIAGETDNRINMTRSGYVLATRMLDVDSLASALFAGYGDDPDNNIRIHYDSTSATYAPAGFEQWQAAPSGVDMLCGEALIKKHYPWYGADLRTLVHIRRAGMIDSQQMGQFMLEQFRQWGGKRIQAQLTGVEVKRGFILIFNDGEEKLHTAKAVNATGPFLNDVANLFGVDLPVHNVLQQKIAFEDVAGAIPRQMPFSIDLDSQSIDWGEEERELLLADPDHAWMAREMPGAIHCRPDGGEKGNWVKLGWAYNETPTQAHFEPQFDDHFPELVLRGASRLNPSLKSYFERLPRNRTHYGGYYTMTRENWPLIGPMGVEGTYVVGAMSGFGTMTACASGELCADWVLDGDLPAYAEQLSLRRYQDAPLMAELNARQDRGLL
ncbi:MAG: FAD-binding oxidoreductase [Rhodospirillaceae bacterium]|jgi:glycine/D-amino acid oxidase-like deaminating enzyme|nr:FAD-binding oxidoreductase [Rhodospirillaceae bacterium]MBT5244011.1 FAD-binding oxidoreductase [Rhodospirillaceae bacterium]MBT5560831.1 FAD-binding oxidoreductase [Rhodospirillaceae bacterium]MBT6240569.1 FAD-binding oxidoreductase [Rhodospirillaceae bacterium]MBT7138361.1 FAD-binding oxidoreductase [Rhodospirillaceae bacterium]